MLKIEVPPLDEARFIARYGPWAVVAGACEGLGACYAEQLARLGINLVLASNRPAALEEQGERLAREHGIRYRTLDVDLSAADAGQRLLASSADLDVGLYISNAGTDGLGNSFLDAPLERSFYLLNLNVTTVVTAVHGFGNRFKARGSGGIIVMSSVGAQIGAPWLAMYAATKAFDLHLAESLWGEFLTVGVDIVGICAPTMDTPNFRRLTKGRAGDFAAQDPALIAAVALARLGQTPIVIFPEGDDRDQAAMVEAKRVQRLRDMVDWATANLVHDGR